MAPPNYMLYRQTTLGVALTTTLDEYVEEGLITKQLAVKILAAFDKRINRTLTHCSRNKVQFKCNKLVTYRFCDNVWTFLLDGVEFRDAHRFIEGLVDKVKIVACDGRSTPSAGALCDSP